MVGPSNLTDAGKANTMQTTSRISNVMWICAAVLLVAAQAAVGGFAVPAGERQLFLDDVGIGEIEGLTRTMHAPAKKGPVIRPTPPEFSIQTRCAPVWDQREKVYKIWYLYGDGSKYGGLGNVESKDGIHWTKVVTDNVPLNPQIATVKAPMNAVYDAADPDPSRRYKGLGHAHGREPFVSANGIDWTPLNVPAISSGDESNMSLDERDHMFLLTAKRGGPFGRSVYLLTSRDFENWRDRGLIFHADELDQKLGRENIKARLADPTLEPLSRNDPAKYNVDVYNMGVFRYESLYIGMPAMYHATGADLNYPNTDGFHLVQLTCSRDLKTWKRLGDRKAFIGPSRRDSGAYDLTQIIGPSNAVVRGEELWFYYTGIKYRSAGSDFVGKFPDGKWVQRPGFDIDYGAICLAVLRRDGFVSLDAGETEGTIRTQPFKLPGGKLLVNVNAIKGELRVEVLAKDDKVLAASAPMKGDLLRHEVEWQTGGIAGLKGKEVRLRFSLCKARLYSYWLK